MSNLTQLEGGVGQMDESEHSKANGTAGLSDCRIGIMQGFWGQNIGNAFFDVGGRWICEHVFGTANVSPIQNQQGYRTFHKQRTGNPKNDLQLLRYLDVDAYVHQGPMFTRSFEALWRPTFEAMAKRGTKVVLLSAGFFRYDDEEVTRVRKFLQEFPPAIISTRDRDTYERVKDLSPFTYCGIDSAFFTPRAYKPVRLTLPPYVVVNFDQYPEPRFQAVAQGSPDPATGVTFNALGQRWNATQPWLQMKLAKAGQWQCYFGSMLDFRRLPEKLGEHLIVRTEHRFTPHIGWKIYRDPNSVVSDEPFTYLTLYNGAELTLSDRVHACVATLAYGRPAMLSHPTPRARLFERLDLTGIRQMPVELSRSRLAEEQEAELQFLKNAIQAVLS